ncbi:MAG: hypothetical protein AAF696_12895 [Bacteroidota bacterium]
MLRLPPRNTALQLVAKDCQNIDPAVSLSFFINQVLEDTLSLVMPCVQDTAFGQHYSRTHEDSDKISYSGFNLSNVVLQYKVFMIHGSSGSVIREGEIPVGNDEFVIE